MTQFTNRLLNAFVKLPLRSEQVERSTLISTFVDVGRLTALLSSVHHQVIYGRRGTGKTHALLYLEESVRANSGIPIYIDMRSMGSNGGIYSDTRLPLAERATRLLVDALEAVHNKLLQFAVSSEDQVVNLAVLGPRLDAFADAITDVTVEGDISIERATQAERSGTEGSSLSTDLSGSSAAIGLRSEGSNSHRANIEQRVTESGPTRRHLHFGRVGATISDLVEGFNGKRVWLLFDEWSAVPRELQPFLADLIKRTLLPVAGMTVKIGAIEQRSVFRTSLEQGDYVGIELGADVSANLNLDDFMVFDNDATRATTFFKDLVFKHVQSILQETGHELRDQEQLVQAAFVQANAFDEFVRSAEGVPRDAINILTTAAMRVVENQRISKAHIRSAARDWYQRDKERSITNADERALLHWIIDKVISERRARAFLLRADVRSELIDLLFDNRVIHLLKRNISGQDRPGIRYDVYKIDYGAYVELMGTARNPLGLLPVGDGDDDYIEVPSDDYRAIRRAILDLNQFSLDRSGYPRLQ